MIIPSKTRPVFVTGVPRCGSSWVGATLAAARGVRYVYEPFNCHWTPALDGRLAHFHYRPAAAPPWPMLERATHRAMTGQQGWKQLARAARRGYLRAALRRPDRVLVKDPTAVLMTEWLATRTGAAVVIITRHPCGFAASLEALGWHFRVERLLRQETLMRDHLAPHESTLRAACSDRWLGRGAFWAAVHTVLHRQAQAHGDWIFQRYEKLCRDPAGGFGSLASALGLGLGDTVLERLASVPARPSANPGSTRKHSAAMADAWRRQLPAAAIDAVQGVVRDFGLES